MAIVFNAGTSRQIRSVVEAVLKAANITSFTLANSSSFKMVAESRDGKYLTVRFTPLDQGFNPTTIKISAPDMTAPSLGAPDMDGTYGSTTLVLSQKDIAVSAPVDEGVAVPSTSVITATSSSTSNAVHPLNTVILNNGNFRIHGFGTRYCNTPWEKDTASAALVAGTKDITMNDAVLATDMTWVEETTAGGAAADHFSAVRKNATDFTVFAHNAAGALVATNTSTVRIHKHNGSTKSRLQASGTLVAGVATLTLANAAGDQLIVQQETAGGTAASHFVAFRSNDTTVKVHAVTAAGALQTLNTSTVTVYNLGASKSACGTCVAGTVDVALAVGASDRLSVVQVTAGGGAANHFSAYRKSASVVAVFAQDNTGAFVNTNTSVVRVYNMGQAAEDTSAVNWTLVRP